MKVKTDESKWGKKINLPEIGTIDVPEDGIIDVPENLGKSLIENLGYVFVSDKKVSDKKESNTSDDSETTFTAETDKGENVKIDMNDLSIEELSDLASGAELDEAEWKPFLDKPKSAKKQLIKYLSTKL